MGTLGFINPCYARVAFLPSLVGAACSTLLSDGTLFLFKPFVQQATVDLLCHLKDGIIPRGPGDAALNFNNPGPKMTAMMMKQIATHHAKIEGYSLVDLQQLDFITSGTTKKSGEVPVYL